MVIRLANFYGQIKCSLGGSAYTSKSLFGAKQGHTVETRHGAYQIRLQNDRAQVQARSKLQSISKGQL